MSQLWDIHITEYTSAMKMKELLLHAVNTDGTQKRSAKWKTRLNRLSTVWFNSNDILKKTDRQRQRTNQWFPGAEDYKAWQKESRSWLCGCMTAYIYPNSQNREFTKKRGEFYHIKFSSIKLILNGINKQVSGSEDSLVGLHSML